MNIETTTIITEEYLGSDNATLKIEVRHDTDYEYGFVVAFGCEEALLRSDDLRWMVKCFNKALRVRKAAEK